MSEIEILKAELVKAKELLSKIIKDDLPRVVKRPLTLEIKHFLETSAPVEQTKKTEETDPEEIWNSACKAQMEEVLKIIPSDGKTNRHSINHWTRIAKFRTSSSVEHNNKTEDHYIPKRGPIREVENQPEESKDDLRTKEDVWREWTQ